MKKFDEEVEHVKKIYNKSWERNWGFVPFTDPDVERLAESLKPLLDPNVVFFVELEGETIGFGLSLPDLNQPLQMAYPTPSSLEAITMVKLAWHWKLRRKVDWLRVFALGVIPEFRGKGVDAMMYLETAKAAVRRGYKWVEMSWILENNDMMNRSIELFGGKLYKTYRMFQKST
jgi:GNAT superfamily N-acetyltransferase